MKKKEKLKKVIKLVPVPLVLKSNANGSLLSLNKRTIANFSSNPPKGPQYPTQYPNFTDEGNTFTCNNTMTGIGSFKTDCVSINDCDSTEVCNPAGQSTLYIL
jgi:hypothetical protein